MILITGGMGFIGLHTARKFLDAGENVVITRYHTWREPSFIKDEYGKRVQVELLDTTSPYDTAEIVRKHKVTGIVHLAVPGLAALSAAEDYRVNMLGLINVLEAARLNGVKRVSIASSTAVYGGLKQGPFKEDDLMPLTAGSATEAFKKAYEVLGQHYADRTGLEVISLRIGGIYGPLYHSMANLPSRMVHAALKGGTVDLSASRGGLPFEEDAGDLCYAKDCGKGIQMIQMAPKLDHRVYNVSTGRATSNKDLAEAVKKAVPGVQVLLKEGKGPTWRPNPALDITRATAETGYKPDFDINSAIADYVGWLKSNPQ